MAITTRYTVLGSSSNFLDFYLPYGDLALDGQDILFKGNTGIDQVYVGSSDGLIFDFTQAGSSTDKIYLEGDLLDYTFESAGSVVTLSRNSGGSETIKVLNTDAIVFANGTISGSDALVYADGGIAPTPAGETSTSFPIEAQGSFDTTVRAVVYDGTGETLALVRPGVALVVKGNSGIDIVYVNAGTNIDATQLLGDADQIYLTGNLTDYSGSVAGSVVTLTRTVKNNTEQVKFLSGADDVIFADGLASSTDLLNLYKDGIQIALDTNVKTPLPIEYVTFSNIRSLATSTSDDQAVAQNEQQISDLQNIWAFDLNLDVSSILGQSVASYSTLLADIDIDDTSLLSEVTTSSYLSINWVTGVEGLVNDDVNDVDFGKLVGLSSNALVDNDPGTASVTETTKIATVYLRAATDATNLDLDIVSLTVGGVGDTPDLTSANLIVDII